MSYDDDDKYHRRRHGRLISGATCLKIVLGGLLCFGLYLVASNSYNVYKRLSSSQEKSYARDISQRHAWVFAKHVSMVIK